MNYFKNACYLALDFSISRYLIANTEGRLNGVEKAETHMEMCKFYIACKYGIETSKVRRLYEDEFQNLHKATQELTSYLDEKIGFPIKGRPDYDELLPKFFEEFHKISVETLNLF